MRLPDIRLVEQAEEKFRLVAICLKVKQKTAVNSPSRRPAQVYSKAYPEDVVLVSLVA